MNFKKPKGILGNKKLMIILWKPLRAINAALHYILNCFKGCL